VEVFEIFFGDFYSQKYSLGVVKRICICFSLKALLSSLLNGLYNIVILSSYTCVAVCCSVLQYLQCVAVCCSVVQCVAVCCGVLQCVAVCCSVLQCAAVCCSVCSCSVLQCVAVYVVAVCVRSTIAIHTQ